MGFFSKFFQSANDAEKAERIVKDLFGNSRSNNNHNNQSAPVMQNVPVQTVSQQKPAANSPSGFSWGEVMPDEENQYNFNGTYKEYFDSIFLSEFRDYQIMCDAAKYTGMPVYTFLKNGRKALVVELMKSKSSARQLRNDCQKAGIPYLRYYIDYHGWWNTKRYVITRTRNALGT